MSLPGGFKDHFSQHAAAYATYRPKSPDRLFEYLASLVPAHRRAWDVGTGNGQAAVELTPWFDEVIATDASGEQIAQALPHPKVTYAVSPAERSGLESSSIDLITVAQAIHWFDFDRFYQEVRRVARPEAVLAVWTYELSIIDPAVDAVVKAYYLEGVGSYWPPERDWVKDHYEHLPFPFPEIKPPPLVMEESRSLAEWVGYLHTWSATQRALRAGKTAVWEKLVQDLTAAWGDPRKAKTVRWPLYLRVGRVVR